jgi:RNA polymerase sigma-70 factor (ECF subfamily)
MQAQRAAHQTGGEPSRRVLTQLMDSPAPETPCNAAALSREASEIARARRNPGAFAPLYERYVDVIYSYCRRRISDPEQAADMTAQIFTRALGAMPRYTDNGGTFRSWLFSIAHNLLVDTYRKQRDVASLDAREHLHLVTDVAPGPEHLALQAELGRALQCAMGELTDGQWEVVELRLAGLTGPEIASVLNMKIAAVKSIQFRAYTRLRELLAPYADPSPLQEKEGQS